MLAEPGNQRGVTLRAVLIGLAFIPVNVYLVVQWETVWDIQDPTTLTIAFQRSFLSLSPHRRQSAVPPIHPEFSAASRRATYRLQYIDGGCTREWT